MSRPVVKTTDPDSSRHLDHLFTLGKGAAINALGYASRTILLYLYSFLLARLLGADGLGLYALAVSIVLLFAQVGELGMRGAVMRFVGAAVGAGNTAKAAAVLRVALVFVLVAGGVLTVTFLMQSEQIATRLFGKPELTIPLRLIAPGIVLLALNNVLAAFTQAFRLMKYKVVVQDVVQLLLQLVLAIMLLVAGLGVEGAVIAYLVAALIAMLLLAYFAGRLAPWYKPSIGDGVPTRELFKFSFPIFLTNILGIFSARANLLLLGMFTEAGDVGVFELVFQISLVGTLFLTSFNMVFGPIVADLDNRKQYNELQDIYQTATRWILTLALPVFMSLALLAGPLLAIFGSEFVVGSQALVILAAAQLLNVAVGSVGYLLTMSGHPTATAVNNAIGLALTVGLNLWLVPRWGLLGAAVAQAMMLAAYNLLGLAEVRLLLKLQPYTSSYLKPLLAAGASGAASFGILQLLRATQLTPNVLQWLQLVAGASVLILVYAGVLLLQGLETVDRQLLSAVKRRLYRYPFSLRSM